jgi:hypothetical protein
MGDSIRLCFWLKDSKPSGDVSSDADFGVTAEGDFELW